MKHRTHSPLKSRRGMALILVMGVGLVILALGMAMLKTSGGILQSTVDTKQRIRARYAAEAMIAIQIARTVEKANQFFGASLQIDESPLGSIGTGNGERGAAIVRNHIGGSLPQELIRTGRLKGMMGLKIPLRIEAKGEVPGGAKSSIDADVQLYQVPIFQFGVFYEGPLEVTPGPDMTVLGPVHTNSNALFRGAGTLTFDGPVTVSGTLYHWYRDAGNIRYRTSETGSTYFLVPKGSGSNLTTTIAALNSTTQPPLVAGIRNVRQGAEPLILPIGGSQPHNLIALKDPSDPPSLQYQKFDWKVPVGSTARFLNGSTPRPAWITGPRVFYDRRESRWVKLWDFDVSLLGSTRDSIFYLADTVLYPLDKGNTKKFLLNAFRIVNATFLPRNMTIASANPIYIQGSFNLTNPTGSCRRAQDSIGVVPADQKYCNVQIAADAVTLLSPNWPNLSRKSRGAHKNSTMDGSLEQPIDSLAFRWTNYTGRVYLGRTKISSGKYDTTWGDTLYSNEPSSGSAGSYSGTITVNAAIFTGNKPSRAAALPPVNYTEAGYEANYEGGWHNSIRFLEDLSGTTVNFNGSFVCMWAAQTKGLDTTAATISIKKGHYSPPTRNWGFDPRFKDLYNMPPGTPFLATAIFTNWLEKR